MYIYIYVYIHHACMHAYIYTYIHTHTPKRTNTHTHTRTILMASSSFVRWADWKKLSSNTATTICNNTITSCSQYTNIPVL